MGLTANACAEKREVMEWVKNKNRGQHRMQGNAIHLMKLYRSYE